jgi:hypothetical protein
LWGELYHQGDVGEASFASVPIIVDFYNGSETIDWNTYAIVALIELARGAGTNPDVPEWLETDYFGAIRSLAAHGAVQIGGATKKDDIRAILSVLAIEKGLRNAGKLLINYSEDELTDFLSGL